MNKLQEGKPRKTTPPAVRMEGFEMFKDGKLNTKTPRSWNWCVGCADLPAPGNFRRLQNDITLSTARINGQHLAQ